MQTSMWSMCISSNWILICVAKRVVVVEIFTVHKYWVIFQGLGFSGVPS